MTRPWRSMITCAAALDADADRMAAAPRPWAPSHARKLIITRDTSAYLKQQAAAIEHSVLLDRELPGVPVPPSKDPESL